MLDWVRCSSVVFKGDTIHWELARSTRYDVLAAYKSKPHVDFMEAKSDGALRVFIRKWGPLRDPAAGSDSAQWYRNKRDFLIALARLLAGIEQGTEQQRSALLALLDVSSAGDDPMGLLLLREWGRLEIPLKTPAQLEDSRKWCQDAPPGEIERLCIRLVEGFSPTAMPSFRIHRRGKRTTVKASFFINNLLEALVWMVWQDVSRSEPIRFCVECGGVIPSETKHTKKFCGLVHAKRNADRNYARRKRAKAKAKGGGKQS